MLCRKESLVLLFTFTFTLFCTYPLPPLSSPALFSIRPNANKKRKNGKLRKADFYFLFGFDKKLSRTFVPIYPYTIAPPSRKKNKRYDTSTVPGEKREGKLPIQVHIMTSLFLKEKKKGGRGGSYLMWAFLESLIIPSVCRHEGVVLRKRDKNRCQSVCTPHQLHAEREGKSVRRKRKG